MRKLSSFAWSVVTLSLGMACNDSPGDTIVLGAGVGGQAPLGKPMGVGGAGTGGAAKGGAAGNPTAGASGTGGVAGASGASTGGASGAMAGGAAGSTAGKGGAAGVGGGGKAGAAAGNAGAAGAKAGAGGTNAGAGGANAGAAGANAGGGGASAGAAGAAGAGGGCGSPSECPQPPAMCVQATCDAGVCGVGPTPAGTAAALQVPGDCQMSVCDGMGAAMPVVDDTDVPPSTACATSACAMGVPSTTPATSGTPCTDPPGGQVCDGAGVCVQCVGPAQCQSTETCTLGKCVAAGGPPLLLSQVQTRGSAGGNDEFIELYNPGAAAVTFDATWTISFRSAVGACAPNMEGIRVTGSGQVIPSHGHILFAGSGYDGAIASDGGSGAGMADAGNLVLRQATTVIDALCFSFDAATLASLTSCATPYVCEGTPVSNLPHDNTTGGTSNSDASLERLPGAAAGNGADTNDNSVDFAARAPATPRDLASPPAPLTKHSQVGPTGPTNSAARTWFAGITRRPRGFPRAEGVSGFPRC